MPIIIFRICSKSGDIDPLIAVSFKIIKSTEQINAFDPSSFAKNVFNVFIINFFKVNLIVCNPEAGQQGMH